ncbi:MAG: phosphoenolpyruvate--protein phosphotransferase [Treponema sp.]|nr:phosphoenolpyruvate--protein phosphotransferase [Treponema sp.]
MNILQGVSASGGIGIGTAFVVPDTIKRVIPQKKISEEDRAGGWKRFTNAVKIVQLRITENIVTLPKDDLQRVIFETYQLMLDDTTFLQQIKNAYDKESYNIEFILDREVQNYADKLRNSGNEYLSERAVDIGDVFGRVLDELLDYHPFNIEQVPDGAVIVAKAMNPSDAVILSKRKIAGLALTEGGVSSHVAILAKNYGIPAVFALENITRIVGPEETIIVDGTIGQVTINPDEKTIKSCTRAIETEKEHEKALKIFRNKSALTKDGTRFYIYANIGTPDEAEIAQKEGADGIGLFRTEFLFMSETLHSKGKQSKDSADNDSNSISEEAQFQAYKQVLQTMGDKPVTIRTLDTGGDKLIDNAGIPKTDEKNPLMGLRAIRLSLKYPELLHTQLRALYRASIYGNLKIMLPLITDVSQIESAKAMAVKVQQELKKENIPFKKNVPIGIMIETAAAAIIADCLAPKCDFFSLGTNDLTQYTIGIDRENPAVSSLYNEFHLAVLRLIQSTINCGEKAKIPVSVCGEMASRPNSTLVLAGMGVRSLSMSAKQITGVKELLSRFTINELQAISLKSLNSL